MTTLDERGTPMAAGPPTTGVPVTAGTPATLGAAAVPSGSPAPAAPVAPAGKPARTRRTRAPKPPMTEGHALLSSATAMTALVCLWVLAQLLFLSALSQGRTQSLLYDDFRTQLAAETAPLGPVIEPGDPVALLRIPEIDLNQVVVEGTSSQDTEAGPGHQRNTPLPGQEGISFVQGRAATYGAPFKHIGELVPGDRFTVVMAQGTATFKVVDVRRPGDPVPPPLAAGAARLTLVSAEGSGHFAAFSPGSVVYVDADSAKSFTAPAGRATDLPKEETVMAGDPGALPLLTLYLALLVALTLGIVAARTRWSPVLVWTVAGPVAIALAWATTDVGVRLLPNLL